MLIERAYRITKDCDWRPFKDHPISFSPQAEDFTKALSGAGFSAVASASWGDEGGFKAFVYPAFQSNPEFEFLVVLLDAAFVTYFFYCENVKAFFNLAASGLEAACSRTNRRDSVLNELANPANLRIIKS